MKKPLVLIGPPGSGKTMLANQIAAYTGANSRNMRVYNSAIQERFVSISAENKSAKIFIFDEVPGVLFVHEMHACIKKAAKLHGKEPIIIFCSQMDLLLDPHHFTIVKLTN